MKTVPEILEELASIGSTNRKTEILEENKGNKVLKETIRLALDPEINFYIKKIPEYKGTKTTMAIGSDTGFTTVLKNLSKYYNREVTGNDAIASLKENLESLTPKYASLLEKVIKRDLDCGARKSIARRVWPDLFLKHHVMLAQPHKEKNMARIKYPAMIQRKEDGMRCSITVVGDEVTWFSRNGKAIPMEDGGFNSDLLGIRKRCADQSPDFINCVFDGELLVQTENGIAWEDRKTGNGILNKILKGKGTPELKKRVRMIAWDVIPYDDWVDGESKWTTFERYGVLDQAVSIPSTDYVIELCWSEIVSDEQEADRIFQNLLANGYEGALLKNMSAGWKDGRSNDWVKMKAWHDIDLKIVGIKPHKKNKKLLGSLECENKDGTIKVSVGSGFDDEDRKVINSSVIGKIVAVKYNERITNKGKEADSLFLPIFLEIREDKTESD